MPEDRSLYDELVDEQLEGASKEDKFRAKLASVSDTEFSQISSYLCGLGDIQKQRDADAPAPELTDEERKFAEMDDAEFAEHIPAQEGVSGGVSRFEPSLSESMKAYRKKLAND
jgi:hypothetical protein